MNHELSEIYNGMLEERVVPDDFAAYSGDNFPDVEVDNEDDVYSSITPLIPDKMSLKEYNTRQIQMLKDYIRGKLRQYENISEEEMGDFVRELIQKRPDVIKKTRLHLAAIEPDLFDYSY